MHFFLGDRDLKQVSIEIQLVLMSGVCSMQFFTGFRKKVEGADLVTPENLPVSPTWPESKVGTKPKVALSSDKLEMADIDDVGVVINQDGGDAARGAHASKFKVVSTRSPKSKTERLGAGSGGSIPAAQARHARK